jgi:hypothetical protein
VSRAAVQCDAIEMILNAPTSTPHPHADGVFEADLSAGPNETEQGPEAKYGRKNA